MQKHRARKKAASARPANEMLPEYDFRGGVRGKYARRVAAGTNLVLLDRDVARAFPDSRAVNRALRTLIRRPRRRAGAAR